MSTFEIPVRFSGRITYTITAASEEDAKRIANEMATEETDFSLFEDIDWEVKSPV